MGPDELIEALDPYGKPIRIGDGVVFEMVDEESGTGDRIAFFVPGLDDEPVIKAFLRAIEDLTDHDIPGRNVFAFGFRPEFDGEVIGVSFRPGKGGIVLGHVPERVISIAEKNGIPFERGDFGGIILVGDSEEDVDALTKLIEAVVFEW